MIAYFHQLLFCAFCCNVIISMDTFICGLLHIGAVKLNVLAYEFKDVMNMPRNAKFNCNIIKMKISNTVRYHYHTRE